MKLQQLLSIFDLSQQQKRKAFDDSFLETEVENLFFDANKVDSKSVFIAIKGQKHDGHDFLNQAAHQGALALVVEKKEKVPSSYNGLVIEVDNTRQILDLLAARFYDFPSQKLFCFGVTGTNGKTSITYFLEHILTENKKKVGVMGTVNHRILDQIWEAQMTTPDPVSLQGRLADFVSLGAQAAALEVSSHALDQKRADSVHFNTVIFTNLTHDHLDYHKDMKSYFESKQKLFTDNMWISIKRPLFAIINIDDDYGRKLKVAEPVIAWTYGQSESDFQFKILNMNFSETEFELITPLEKMKIKIPLTGVHTVYNVVASLASALTCGISLENSVKSLLTFKGIPGRLQRVETLTGKIVFVDYAHTPDALQNSLSSLQKIKSYQSSPLKSSQIITVFGCGGDRDKTKRPEMAKISQNLSDYVVVTSDNPRSEDPTQILQDIKNGFSLDFKNYHLEVDREKAIAWALQKAQDQDVVLIAGKGHETYQIIKDEKKPFSDYDIAQKYL